MARAPRYMTLKGATMWGGGKVARNTLSAGGPVFLDLKQGDFAGVVHAPLPKARLPAFHSWC